MQPNFTQEDVLLYIYNELEPSQREAIEMAIATDKDLLVFYQKAMLIQAELNRIQEEPGSTVISILNEETRSSSMEIH